MNFSQPWRKAGIVDVAYSIELPIQYFLDVLDRELPELMEDSRQFPDPPERELELEKALRERGWPSPHHVGGDPGLAHLALEYFASDMLLEWLGAGTFRTDDTRDERFVLNTVHRVSLIGGVPLLEGAARRDDMPVRYQDV